MTYLFRLKLLKKHDLYFDYNNPPENISQLYNKTLVCLILVFEIIGLDGDNGKPHILITGNIHLLFNFNRGMYIYIIYIGDIKLCQLDLIMQTMSKIKEFYSSKEHKVSLIMGGDFNSSPNSGIYNYMSKGEYNCQSLPREEISGQNSVQYQFFDPINPEKFLEESRRIMKERDLMFEDITYLHSWYPEILNSYINIDILSKELSFHRKMPFLVLESKVINKKLQSKINAEKIREILCQTGEEYKRLEKRDEGETEIPRNKLFEYILKNPAGCFQSACSDACVRVLKYIEDNIQGGGMQYEELRAIYQGFNGLTLQLFTQEGEDFGENAATLIRESTLEPNLTLYLDLVFTPDYIWFNSLGGKVTQILQFPSFNVVREAGLFPNLFVPSDHLPIVLNIQFTK